MPALDVTFDRQVRLDDIGLICAVAEAEAVAKFIRGVPLPPAVQNRLDRLNIVRAVRGTTGIEGADLDEDEVRRVLEAPPDTPVLPAARAREEQEARNAEAVMRFGAETTGEEHLRPLTEGDIREMHRPHDRRDRLPQQRAPPLPLACGTGGRLRPAPRRCQRPPPDGRIHRLAEQPAGGELASDRPRRRRPLLLRQHPPLRRRQRADGAGDREIPALPDRGERARLLFARQLLLPQPCGVHRTPQPLPLQRVPRPHALHQLRRRRVPGGA